MSNLSLRYRRDPFAQLDALVRETFGEVPTLFGTRAGRVVREFVPAAEVDRDGEDAVVRVELPGLDAERDVTVEVDNGVLVVRGERRDERAEDRDGARLREVRYGAFRRAFRLPSGVSADAVSAAYDAGVLTVRVAGAYAGTGARRVPVAAAPAAPAVEPAA